MSTMTVETKITPQYLNGKSKQDLITMILNMLDRQEAFERTGAGMIAGERIRQVEGEGWTAEHDDQWKSGELAIAGACYAAAERWMRFARAAWPWDLRWWKPGATIRNLVKAGALIAAEIDRLKREAKRHG